METKDVLLSQFRENTGGHFLDSGGAYGRHWERNQARDIEGEQGSVIEVWEDKDNPGHSSDWCVTHNTFQWLNDHVGLVFDEELQKEFEQFVEENNSDMQMSGMEEFVQHLIDNDRAKPFLDGRNPVAAENTYNHECLLDQTLQFVLFNMDGEDYVALQVHGGCDVRGGYTDAKIYSLGCYEGGFNMLSFTRAGISDGENSWYSDDGYNWYPCNDEPELPKVLKLDTKGRILSPINGQPFDAYFS